MNSNTFVLYLETRDYDMAIITAPDYLEANGSLVFLAGPIIGAEDWQKTAIEFISRECPEINIASPRGDYSNRRFDFNAQVDWETHYLNEAAKDGLILFWLAREKEHRCNWPYAQTTRFELAKWITRYENDRNLKISIGIEPDFAGERYIKKVMGQDFPEIQIYSSLNEVCKEVVKRL